MENFESLQFLISSGLLISDLSYYSPLRTTAETCLKISMNVLCLYGLSKRMYALKFQND